MGTDRLDRGIYWDASWNFVFGCAPVGEGCKNCWAKANHERWGRNKPQLMWRNQDGEARALYGGQFNDVNIFPDRLDMPLHWRKPRVVAVNFSGDPFHKKVSDEILDKAFAVMALCPQHTFIVLTKRWEGMAEYCRSIEAVEQDSERAQLLWDAWGAIHGDRENWRPAYPLPNVQFGVSVSTQAELNAAMPHLLATPAAVRLLSLEPLLGRVCLKGSGCQWCYGRGVLPCGEHVPCDVCLGIDGVIVGCESGPNRRPCPIEHIESLVAQTKAAGVKCFVKQVDIDGGVSTDMSEWPESIRVRELPDG